MSVTESSPPAQLEPRKAALREYFGPAGFERWKMIYGEGPVSFIRRTVREGHAEVVGQVMEWVGSSSALRVLDAGCGPGMVSLLLARQGHTVRGYDLSEQMVEAAWERLASEAPEVRNRVEFNWADLENLDEQATFDLAICLDVLIYYPEAELTRLLARLKLLAPGRLIFTYAPASLLLRAMHWTGQKFPRRQRASRLEIIGEKAVKRALAANGWHLARQRHFNKGFYHVVLAEAVA